MAVTAVKSGAFLLPLFKQNFARIARIAQFFPRETALYEGRGSAFESGAFDLLSHPSICESRFAR